MKFLIAGFGSIGRRHFRNLLTIGEKDIIFYRTSHSTLPDDELRGYTVETDLRKALDHKPNAVIIANPTALHLDVAIPAAERGCHILMEKPISHNLNRLDKLEAALKKGKGKLLMGFQFRFHPTLQKAASLIKDGAIDRPLSAVAHWGEYLPNWHPWEDYRQGYSARSTLGGGVVLTLSHPLDYLRWLMGEVDAVFAITGKNSGLEIDVEDVAEIGLRFAQRKTGFVHLDYFQQPATHTLEITGSGGTLRWDNNDGILKFYKASAGSWRNFLPPENFERNKLFLDELFHFRSVARGDEEPLCTLKDGVRALEIAQAVHTAAVKKRLVEL
jgi:predicted dehydrogenase